MFVISSTWLVGPAAGPAYLDETKQRLQFAVASRVWSILERVAISRQSAAWTHVSCRRTCSSRTRLLDHQCAPARSRRVLTDHTTQVAVYTLPHKHRVAYWLLSDHCTTVCSIRCFNKWQDIGFTGFSCRQRLVLVSLSPVCPMCLVLSVESVLRFANSITRPSTITFPIWPSPWHTIQVLRPSYWYQNIVRETWTE